MRWNENKNLLQLWRFRKIPVRPIFPFLKGKWHVEWSLDKYYWKREKNISIVMLKWKRDLLFGKGSSLSPSLLPLFSHFHISSLDNCKANCYFNRYGYIFGITWDWQWMEILGKLLSSSSFVGISGIRLRIIMHTSTHTCFTVDWKRFPIEIHVKRR